MPYFGSNSKKHRDTCHPDLIKVLDEAINHYDFSCVWGHRPKEVQDRVFEDGFSQVRWPNSKHNKIPSRAFDVVPYPGGFNNPDEAFYEMATHILGAASKLGVRLRWGGHWRNFKDLAHFELRDDNGDRDD